MANGTSEQEQSKHVSASDKFAQGNAMGQTAIGCDLVASKPFTIGYSPFTKLAFQ
jgi:hypothetical protein